MTVEAPMVDIVDYAIGGGWGKEEPDQAHTLPVYVLRGTDMPSVKLGDVSTLPYRYENAKKGQRRALLPNDIVLEISGGSSARGQSTGRTVFISESVLNELDAALIPASFCRLLRIKPEIADPRYVYYCLQEMYNSGRAATYEVQSTGISNFQFKYFLEAESVPLPPLAEQETIAEILGTLDDKIKLNRKMNATLDELARTIFRSWFVDFDPVRAKMEGREPFGMDAGTAALFPDRLVDSPLGPVPDGWQVKRLGDVTTELRRGISPKYVEEDGVLVLNQKCIRDGRVDIQKARRHDPSQRSIAGRELQPRDILVNSTGVGTLGRIAQLLQLSETTICDSHVTVVRANDEIITANVLGIGLGLREAEVEALGHGSTGQTELSRAALAELRIVVPPENIQDRFDSHTIPLRSMISANENESRTLTELRDTLLPELISGRIRVPEAEKAVAEVV